MVMSPVTTFLPRQHQTHYSMFVPLFLVTGILRLSTIFQMQSQVSKSPFLHNCFLNGCLLATTVLLHGVVPYEIQIFIRFLLACPGPPGLPHINCPFQFGFMCKAAEPTMPSGLLMKALSRFCP